MEVTRDGDFLDHRPFRVLGQVADGIDALAHFIQCQPQVVPSSSSMKMAEAPCWERAISFLVLGRVLMACSTGMVMERCTSSGGPAPGDGDGDVVEIEIRKQLGVEAIEPQHAEHDHQQHQQVGGNLVLGKAGDQAP